MDSTNGSELLHYKRGIYFVDKLIKLFVDGKYDVEKEREFCLREHVRFVNNDIAIFDLNNFMFLCTVSLMGMNKEAIENSKNVKDYKYKINYSVVDFGEKESIPEYVIKAINEFNDSRRIESEYDDWLSISDINHLSNPNFIYNYLFNVRNAFMHSEYNFDLSKYHPAYIVNLNNSNYSGFKAKIFVSKYYEFVKHYFSNDSFFGLVESMYGFDIPDGELNINNEEELLNFIIKEIKIKKYTYDNKLNANKICEKTLFSYDHYLTDYEKAKHNIVEEDVELSSDDMAQVLYLIKDYYGEEFYSLPDEKKFSTMVLACKYVLNPKLVMSSWIMHFYQLTKDICCGKHLQNGFVSFFAMQPTLLTLKSYLILYRLQNHELRKSEIDYNLINNIEFDYEEEHYSDYKNKLVNKGFLLDENEYKNRYFIDIFRDSLAHGNFKIIYKKEDDKISKCFQFTDEWKSKKRIVTISTDQLESFLSSKCFDPREIVLEESKHIN